MEANRMVDSMADRLHRFHAGTETRAWEWMGAHPALHNGQEGVVFRVWAPHAADVSVITESNGWLRDLAPMSRMEHDPTMWECFLTDVRRFDSYKYSIRTQDGQVLDKSDPFAFHAETRPYTASKVYSMAGYEWHDRSWMRRKLPRTEPMNIYEVHLGSWQVREDSTFYSYREMADRLIPYVCGMGYTHLELLPLLEHPFDGSWGYQPLGWFAATSRYGTPHDLMYFIDRCHQAGLGVILDWTAAGFPGDAHGLICFDGAACYECPPPDDTMPFGMRRFDLGKEEVISFLLSSAMFWMSEYHIDGLRVSSVQPMLFLDYEKEDGSWTANQYGENTNLEGARFLRTLCDSAAGAFPRVKLIASSTGLWSSVTKPTAFGGLGFSHMWRDDWVQQVLAQLQTPEAADDALVDWLTLSLINSMGEQYILPLSHDAVSHGRGSLLAQMPGEYNEKFAHLRVLYGFVMAHPGDKLLFMGGEFAQFNEWACHHGLDWSLLEYEAHRQMREYVRGLNLFYKNSPALWEAGDADGFTWVDRGTQTPGLLAFLRTSAEGDRLLAVVNLTGQRVSGYTIQLDAPGTWEEVFSSDSVSYGGSGMACGVRTAKQVGGTYQLTLSAAAHSIQFFSPDG